MPTITDIQVQKKDKDRVSLFVDHKFWNGMSRQCFNDLRIKNGQVFNDQEFAELAQRVAEDSGFSFALKRLGYRQLSSQELRDKMLEKEFSEDVIELTITKCIDFLFIDDRSMAESIIDIQIEQGRGSSRIKEYLLKRKLDREMVDELLAERFAEEDVYLLAEKALTRKYRQQKFDRKKQKQAAAYLVRQGFNFTVAEAVASSRQISDQEEAELHPASEARALISRKYGFPLNQADKSKAYAFLSRRGFLPDVIRAALEDNQD